MLMRVRVLVLNVFSQTPQLANTLSQDGTTSKAATTVDELFDELSSNTTTAATDKGKEEGSAPLINF